MGGVSSRDDTATTAEDRRPGAYHRAKDLDPLFEGLPLEERLYLRLGGSALLKETSRDKNFVPLLKQKGTVRLKHPRNMNPGLAAMCKASTENVNEEK